MMRVTRFVPTMMLLALAAGCGGGQTGDLSGENGKKGGTNGSASSCEDQLSPISLDDSSALGFSAESLMPLLGSSQTVLAWQALPNVEYSPGESESALTLALVSQDQAWFVHSAPVHATDGEGGGALLEPLCPPDRLRLAVRAELHTADGALAEAFDTTLDARSANVATLSRTLGSQQLAGSFAVTRVTPLGADASASASVQDFSFDAVLTRGGIAGSLTAQLTTMNAQVAGSSRVTFARFPSDTRCAADPGRSIAAVPVTADSAALGQTGAAAIGVVNGWGTLPLSWAAGSHSELQLTLSELGDGCIQVPSGHGFDDPSLPAATVVYPVTLRASTADGRWHGEYPASLATWPSADGSRYSERIELNKTFGVDATLSTGFDAVSVPEGTQRLSVRLEALFGDAGATGNVSLDALKDPPCVTQPVPSSGNSTPGCSGTQVTPLLGATWAE